MVRGMLRLRLRFVEGDNSESGGGAFDGGGLERGAGDEGGPGRFWSPRINLFLR